MIITKLLKRVCVFGTGMLLVLSSILLSPSAARAAEITDNSPDTTPVQTEITETAPSTEATEVTEPNFTEEPTAPNPFSTIRPDYFKWWETDDDLIRGLVSIYGGNGHKSWDSVDFLLQELALMDEAKAERWRSIIEYWDYTNNGMKINNNILPKGLNDTDHLCLMVLGYELEPDGNIRPELQGRLRTLLSSAVRYPNAYILCAGGGTAAIPEATAMAQWLIEHGIDEERIILEDKSRTTAQNIRFSYRILTEDYPEITDIALITSDYHVRWGAVLLYTMFTLGDHPLELVSNAAYPTNLRNSNVTKRQMEGILALSGLS